MNKFLNYKTFQLFDILKFELFRKFYKETDEI